MSTIRELTLTALAEEGIASHSEHPAVTAAIQALEEREQSIYDRIAFAAEAAGIDGTQVAVVLTQAGLAVRGPEAEVEETTEAPVPTGEVPTTEAALDQAVAETVAGLLLRVQALEAAAERHGVTV